MEQIAQQRVLFLGAGSMGEAMVKGLLAANLLPAEQISVCNRSKTERLEGLQRRYGVRICEDKAAEIRQANLVILAVKPFDLQAALQDVIPYLSAQQLVISVAAGISTATIEGLINLSIPVIRAMPNTSSAVQASATAICAGRWATAAHMRIAHQFFSAIGNSVQVEEKQMNAVTGVSGTGPAYIYYVMEALLQAGQECGLSEDICRTLLVQTLYGTARMLQESDKDPAELRRQVTSPNGTTMAGMAVLDQGNGQQLFLRAVQAATQRAAELGRVAAPVLALSQSGEASEHP